MDSIRLSYINAIHSVVIGLVSYWEFNDTILRTPEIYFSMFLALIALTFTNNIRAGNKALTRAALVCAIIVFIMQVYYAIPTFQDIYLPEKIAKGVNVTVGLIMVLTFSLNEWMRMKS